jgi:hypothetical protein
MSKVPGELRYLKSHEWARLESDGTITIGISDHAQQALGDLVFVEAPEEGRQVTAGEACAVVESVKAASDVYSPVSGQVVKLFNPRKQVWSDHFEWIDGGTRILGLTAVGRATVAALQLNREALVISRKKWVSAGWHPPSVR